MSERTISNLKIIVKEEFKAYKDEKRFTIENLCLRKTQGFKITAIIEKIIKTLKGIASLLLYANIDAGKGCKFNPIVSNRCLLLYFRYGAILRVMLLSSFGKFLAFPAVVWGQTHSAVYLGLARLFIFTSNVVGFKGMAPQSW